MNEFRIDDPGPRDSQELVKSFFAHASIGFSITDLQGRFLEVNPAYCELTGYTEAELKARDFASITHPDDLRRTMEEIEKLLSGKTSACLIEKRYIRRDGVVVWVMNNVSVIRDQHGHPINLVRLSQDITERKRADERLREYEKALEGLEEMIAVVDRDYRYLLANRAFLKQRGMAREQVVGHRVSEILDAQLFDQVIKPKLDRSFQGKVVKYELNYSYPEIGERVLFISYFPIEGPHGVDRVACVLQDITERRQAEERLFQSENQLTEAQHLAHIGSWHWDLQTNSRSWSAALYRIFGLNPNEPAPSLDTALIEAVHPKDRELVRTAVEASIASREPCSFSYRIIRPDGAERVIHSRGDVIVDERGNPTRMFGTAHDITDRRRAEDALREAEQKYRDIFENAGEGIFQSTPEGQYLVANPALAKMHGYDSPADLIRDRNDISEIYVDPDQRVKFRELLEQHGTVRGFEHQIFRKDGSKIWISVNARAVRDGKRQILYYEGTAQDITERKRSEEELRISEERYRDLVENSRELICTHDLEGLVLSANPAAAAALGYELDEYVGQKNIRDLLAPEVSPQFDEYMARLREQGSTSGLMLVQTKSGERRVWEYHNSLRTEGVATPIVRGMARDITEERRAQKALHESEERFSKAFYSSPAPLIITRLADGCFLNANDSFLRTFEYERDEVIGKTAGDLNIYVDAEGRQKMIDQLQERGSLRGCESQARTRSGRILELLIFVEQVKLNGEHCILSTTHDITERKGIEQALRESEERYRELFENARDALYVHDLSGRYTSFNRAAEQLSGYSREEILGRHFSNFVAPAYLKDVRENLCRKLDDVGETTYEIDLITKDRRRVPVEVSSRLIYQDGEPVGVQGVARDITERKRAEEARSRFAAIVESSDDAIISTTLDGTIVSWNSGAEKIYGYTARELIGCHVSVLAAPDRIAEVPGHLERIRKGESISHYETLGRRKDGNVINVSLTISPVRDAQNRIAGVSTIARDVTESKQAEQALQTFSRRLIEAQEAERQHIARELHDEIGQVLTAVRINLQSLKRSARNGPEPFPIEESLSIVDEALDQVRELSFDLRPPVLDNLGLGSALRWYINRYARRSGIIAELRSDLEDGQRLRVELETACFRIVQEALTNVARHAQATRVLVRLTRNNGNLNLKIRDNGVGFNFEELLKAAPPAWALGLRGMKERAVAALGTFKIESAPMRGTVVRASFPLKDGS